MDFEIIRKELGPTKAVHKNDFTWNDEVNVIGDISKASKIRIGIKTLRHGENCYIFFGEEKNQNSKGIIYYMDVG